MQEQALQEAAESRLTEKEASLIVALHSEQEQRDGATTLRDLAETLHISLAEAQHLLAQVRATAAPAPTIVEPTPPRTRKARRINWGKRPTLTKTLLTLFLLATFFVAVRIWSNDKFGDPTEVVTQITVPAMSNATRVSFPIGSGEAISDDLPFQAKHVLDSPQSTTTAFEVAIRIGSDYAIRTLPNPPQSSNAPPKAEIQLRLANSIFESFDYASRNTPASDPEFFTVGVRLPQGNWTTMDIPTAAWNGNLQNSIDHLGWREAMKDRMLAAVQKHWSEFDFPGK